MFAVLIVSDRYLNAQYPHVTELLQLLWSVSKKQGHKEPEEAEPKQEEDQPC